MLGRLFNVQTFDGCGGGASFGFSLVLGNHFGLKGSVAPNLQTPCRTMEMRQDKPIVANPGG